MKGNEMVWDGGSETLEVLIRWFLLGFSLDGALVWTCSVWVGFTERSVGRRLRVTYEAMFEALQNGIGHYPFKSRKFNSGRRAEEYALEITGIIHKSTFYGLIKKVILKGPSI